MPEISEIEKVILDVLKNQRGPITTYQIAKEGDISWATANVHLKDLQFKGLIKGKREKEKSGKVKMMWWIEQKSLDKFLK